MITCVISPRVRTDRQMVTNSDGEKKSFIRCERSVALLDFITVILIVIIFLFFSFSFLAFRV